MATTHIVDRSQPSDQENEALTKASAGTTPVRVMVVQRQPDESSFSGSKAKAVTRLICFIISLIIIGVISGSSDSRRSRQNTQYYSSSSGSFSTNYKFDTTNYNYNYDQSSFVKLNVGCTGAVCEESAKEIMTSFNTSIDPCDNFYDFACQGWQTENPRPEYLADWSAFNKLELESVNMTIEILNEPVNNSLDIPALVQAKKYYKKCMDVEQYENQFGQDNETMQWMLNTLEQYGGWPMLYEEGEWDSSKFSLVKSVAGLRRQFASSVILDVKVYQSIDGDVNSNTIILRRPTSSSSADQSFATVFSELTYSLKVLQTYNDFIVNVSRQLLHFKGVRNINETKLYRQAANILSAKRLLQSAGAKPNVRILHGFTENVAREKLEKLQTLMIQNNLAQNTIGWGTIISPLNLNRLLTLLFAGTNIHISSQEKVIVDNLDYLLGVSMVLSKIDPIAIANYLHYHMVFQMISMIPSSKLKSYMNALEASVDGTTKAVPRDQVCANKVQKKFAFAVGQKYVLRKYPNSYSSNKDFVQVSQLFNNIRASLSSLVSTSKQVDYSNRKQLLQELQFTELCRGAPTWIYQKNRVQTEYAGLHLSDSTNFIEQTVAINEWMVVKKLKGLRKQADNTTRCYWTRFVGNVGPYNRLWAVYAPMGILKAPFFNVNLPKSLIYGKLGSILGHELTHGMVNNKDGWTTDDITGKRTKMSNCLIDSYSNFTFSELNNKYATLDGVSTLEENLSDNAGILAAYNAFKRDFAGDTVVEMDGLEEYTDEQLFYIGFAQNWCRSSTLQSMLYSMSGEDHSPGRFRVLGTLQNSKEFAQVWNCSLGSKMNPSLRNNQEKCKLF